VSSVALAFTEGTQQAPRIAYTLGDVKQVWLASCGDLASSTNWVSEWVGVGSSGVSLSLRERERISYLDNYDLCYSFRTATLPLALYNPLRPCTTLQTQPAAVRYKNFVYRKPTRQQAEEMDDMDLFRSLRDLMATTPEGLKYIDWYYKYSPEIARLALADPALMYDAYRTLQNIKPAIVALVSGTGNTMVLEQEIAQQFNDIAQRIIPGASDELRQAIEQEQASYNSFQSFAGHSMDYAGQVMHFVPPSVRLSIDPSVDPYGSVLTWEPVPQATAYRIETTTNVVNGPWIPAATVQTNVWTNTLSQPQLYHRLNAVMP
jgi:hypothetical protein